MEELFSSLAHGKYSFLLDMIPDFDAPRPLHMTLGEAAGRSLFKWLLSSHSLEVETGRYERKPREQRFCQRCRRLIFCDIIGDERHALIECARGEEEKLNFQRKRTVFFVASSDGDDDDEVIFVSQVPPRR